jgi:hypothetical protein
MFRGKERLNPEGQLRRDSILKLFQVNAVGNERLSPLADVLAPTADSSNVSSTQRRVAGAC